VEQFLNCGLQNVLRANASQDKVVQTLLKELWRGGRLLAACLPFSKDCLAIRMDGQECLCAFTSMEAALAFRRMLMERGAPPVDFHEFTLEELMARTETDSRCLALDAGTQHCVFLPPVLMNALKHTTTKLTGGRMPAQDLPLMRLHLSTLGNAKRVHAASQCACFHCRKWFPASEVQKFMPEKDGRETALCPRCGVDAVLTDQDSLPLTRDLTDEMHSRFFSEADVSEAGLRLLYMECVRERIRTETV